MALRERLHSAEQENLRRSKELNLVLEEIKRAIAEKQALRDINRTWSSLSEETRLKLWNVSSKSVLQLPSIFHHLPHLLNREDSLLPAVHLGQGRTGVSIVMGVPSVKREVHSYLTDTLSSLMSELSAAEKLTASSWSSSQSFPAEIQSGLLEVVSPSVHFYPDFSKLRESFGDPKERVRWRTKQNLDYCYLMMYAQSKGTYYVQLEDDIVARPNFFTTEELRPAAAMFKSLDLSLIVEFMLISTKTSPSTGSSTTSCGSSHANPLAGHDLSEDLPALHSGEGLPGGGLLLGLHPVSGDFIRIRFFTPVRIERFFFRSGHMEHPGDKLFNTSVEVLPFDNIQAEKEALTEGRERTPKYHRTEDGFIRIGETPGSVRRGRGGGEVDASFGPLEAMRLSPF
ncbi:hypothetical protein F7725_010675 [Dissostichus mawsoni]|uniref:Alpha-1,3-mannosyl-glycoprotein 4-beta-N-acetylglucosaminyltransferase B n=1 Tax=Dissostichus mawsoni TaxID=36200 RepID=A0A7J5XQQ8_DISMA|nr:hypothetical protein F7725_010675 [Dissostichus mawsoni]